VTAAPAHTATMAPASVEGIVYRSTVLPMQPVITNQAVPHNNDLAAAVPSAPVPVHAPVPPKTNGDLGRFTAILAGTVVPQPILPVVPPVMREVLELLLSLVLSLVFGVSFVFSYGQWLRKGGFATAPRSDESARLFASSSLVRYQGYATTPPRWHNPLLVVFSVGTSYRHPSP